MATLQNLPDAVTVLPAPGGAATSPVALRSILYAVFKHRRLVLGILALVFLGSAAAAFLRPRTWLASSKVLLKRFTCFDRKTRGQGIQIGIRIDAALESKYNSLPQTSLAC